MSPEAVKLLCSTLRRYGSTHGKPKARKALVQSVESWRARDDHAAEVSNALWDTSAENFDALEEILDANGAEDLTFDLLDWVLEPQLYD